MLTIKTTPTGVKIWHYRSTVIATQVIQQFEPEHNQDHGIIGSVVKIRLLVFEKQCILLAVLD